MRAMDGDMFGGSNEKLKKTRKEKRDKRRRRALLRVDLTEEESREAEGQQVEYGATLHKWVGRSKVKMAYSTRRTYLQRR